MSKLVNFVVEVPSDDYCWPPSDGDLENREMCSYLELSGGCAKCILGFDVDSPTEKTPFVKKDPECASLEDYIEEE
jgi:hypothetical protein